MADAPRPRTPTTAETFFQAAFGCFGTIVFKVIALVVIILIADWNAERRSKRRERERAETSAIADRIADEVVTETDADGRFVRRPEGALPEADVWGRPFRLMCRFDGSVANALGFP